MCIYTDDLCYIIYILVGQTSFSPTIEQQVGDVISSGGPDVLTSCASIYGRLLQLNTEYLVGVGGPCSSAFYEWAELSVYTESDLQLLRKIREQVDYGLIECGSLALHASMTLVVLTATGLSYLM